MYEHRERAWGKISEHDDRIRDLTSIRNSMFLTKMTEAKNKNFLCHYLNGNNSLCSGYVYNINHFDLRVKMRNADFPKERPSAFDGEWVWWMHILKIDEETVNEITK